MFFERSKVLEYLFYLMSATLFFGKIYQVFAISIVILFFVDTIRKKSWFVFNDKIFLILNLWCLYLATSAFWAINPFSTLKGVLTLYMWCCLYLVVRHVFITQQKIHSFVRFQVFVIGFIVINVFMQFTIGFNIFGTPIEASRVTDLLSSNKIFSYILPLWIGLFGAFLSIKGQSHRDYILYALSLICILLVMPLSGSRGPLLILIVFLPLIAWMSPYRKWAFMILGLLFIISSYMVMTMPHLLNRLETLKNPFENQKHYRVAIWLTALEQFKDNPILGVGFKNYRDRQFEYYQDSFESHEINPTTGSRTMHTHSPWMDILAEQGLIGLLFAFILLATIARRAYAQGGAVIIGSMGVWYAFSFLNSSFVLSSARWSFFMIFAISFFAIVENYYRIEYKEY